MRSTGAVFLTRWAEVAAEIALPADRANDIGLDLVARHSEPHRHYHTMDHIVAVLNHLQTLHVTTPTALLAAFFHDAIYDPTRGDNEARSAELVVKVLGEAGPPGASLDATAADVAQIVTATATHQLPADGPRETAAFLDADLAILAAPAAAYDTYVANIRAEYGHVPDDEFGPRRALILQGFLDRERLFFTTAGQALFEVHARANLAREIASL